MKELTLYTDGASRGNPGHAGAGVVIEDGRGMRLAGRYRYLGMVTNNQAEYLALIEGLKAIRQWEPEELHIRMDSNLLVEQIKGVYKVKNIDLKPLFEHAMSMLRSFKYDIQHVPREKNRGADALANKAIDEHVKGPAARG